jgi:very-short-patch-repair endonuclease
MLKNTKKYTIVEIKTKFYNIHQNKYDYSLFTEYKNTKKKISIICKEHGVFCQQIAMHLIGQGCPECKKTKLSNLNKFKLSDILLKFKNTHGDKYDYSKIIEYLGYDEKIQIDCPIHGSFFQICRNHIAGGGCPKCYNDKRYAYKSSNKLEFEEKCRLVYGDKYDYSLVQYKNSKTPVEIICPIHGSFFKNPNNHLNGEGCPLCFSSKGERKIFSILKGNGILFERQKTYNDCKYINKLRFDFYLPEYNMCIEYNGEQHYKDIQYWNNSHLLNIKRDNIKKTYCENNNIELLIISYLDDIYITLKNRIDNIVDFNDLYSEYLTYNEAKIAIKKLNIHSQLEYNKKYKLDNSLPSHPASIYKLTGWINWSSFLDKKSN